MKGSLLLFASFTIASLSHLPAQTDPSSAQNTAGAIPSAPAVPAYDCSSSLCKDKADKDKDDKDWELPSSGTVTVPAKNGVEFDAMIDGKGPFRLIFDSGAGVNVLSPAVANQLGLRVGGDPLQLKGTGGSVISQAVHVDTLRIGELALHDQMFYVSPMPWGDRPGPVGAVGYEIMRRLVVTVDYQRQQLTFNAPLLFNDSGHGVKVPLEPPPRGVQVKASVDGESGVFGIDTGDEASLGLQEWFVSQYGFVKRLAPPYHGYAGSGVGGPMPSAYYGRVQTLRIGQAEVDRVIAFLFDGQAFPGETAGNIGTRVLRQFNITFDYPRGVLYLEKNSNWGKPGIFNRAGVVVDSIQQDHLVRNVVPGSPGEKAGIAVGDVILKIDGRAPSDDPLVQDDPAFLQPVGTVVHLTVKRGNTVRKIRLTLREVL